MFYSSSLRTRGFIKWHNRFGFMSRSKKSNEREDKTQMLYYTYSYHITNESIGDREYHVYNYSAREE